MSVGLELPQLYHWSPTEARERIKKRGLKPTCRTAAYRAVEPEPDRGHYTVDVEAYEARAVCFATSPYEAWALSGAVDASRGSRWDLWEFSPADEYAVLDVRVDGARVAEVRVEGWVRPRDLWLVGSRVVGGRRWSHA